MELNIREGQKRGGTLRGEKGWSDLHHGKERTVR